MAGLEGRNRWLFGPFPDLALGCGLAYAVIFGALSILGVQGREWQPLFLAPLLSLLLSGPHYGGTLLRVYEHRADRRSYAIFSIWATLAVIAAFFAGVRNLGFGAWFLTLYITWSPWHYTGQNYGIAVMFLRRRGVELSPLAKRLLYVSFICSFGITFCVLHGSNEVEGYLPNPVSYDSSQLAMRSLGIPRPVSSVLLGILTFGYVGSLVSAAVLLRRRAPWKELGSAAALCVTQALWFALPFSVQFWKLETGLDPLDVSAPQYILWIAVGHAVQYLWVTTYYAKTSGHWSGYTRYLAKAAAAGAAVWTLPVVFFAPGRLGDLEYSGGLFLLVAAAVNIHHFILDGAIWKLRDSRVGSVLIRASSDAASDDSQPRRWTRRLVWTISGAAAIVALALVWLQHFAFPDAMQGEDYERSNATLDRVAWFGQDSSRARNQLAAALLASGDFDAAESQYRRSLALSSNAIAWGGIASVSARRSDWHAVLTAYETSLELGPLNSSFRALAAMAHYQLGQPESSRAILDGVLDQTPESAQTYERLAQFAHRNGDSEWAVRAYREALRLAPDRIETASTLAWILATDPNDSVRDGLEAARLIEPWIRAAEPADPNHLDTLAVAYAASGRFDAAVQTAERAIGLADERGNERVSNAARAHLALFRSHRPYLEPPRSGP